MHYIPVVIASVLQQIYEEMDVEQCNYMMYGADSIFFSPLWILTSIVGVCILIILFFTCGMSHKIVEYGLRTKKKLMLCIWRIALLVLFSTFIVIDLAVTWFHPIILMLHYLTPNVNDQNITYMTWREITECNSVTVRIVIIRHLLSAVDVTTPMLVMFYIMAPGIYRCLSKISGDKIDDHEESQVQVLYLIKFNVNEGYNYYCKDTEYIQFYIIIML